MIWKHTNSSETYTDESQNNGKKKVLQQYFWILVEKKPYLKRLPYTQLK